MAGLQHVRQQLLAERAAIDHALAEAGESSKVQVAFVAEHRFRALGGMELLTNPNPNPNPNPKP